MNTKQVKENKLKMILGFSIPSIIAMMLQTVITKTDGYFTGNYVGDQWQTSRGKRKTKGFRGVLGLGVQGSAIGSLLVQTVTVLISLGYFLSQKAGIRFRRFRFDRMAGREMILNGSSEFIGEMVSVGEHRNRRLLRDCRLPRLLFDPVDQSIWRWKEMKKLCGFWRFFRFW